jgi:sugar phosphate isomerase/epimerase
MERLAATLPALTAGCHGLGLPFGIENHGDYYCSDLVSLCQEVPHLGIFLDTGNTYLIGEVPLPAFEAAAPYVVGSHFKDHHVRPCPDAHPLHFEVGPSIIGDGDVPLRECYQLLLEKNPNPDSLVMEIELIPPSGIDPVESFERSVNFVKSLPAVQK